jgi:hypothetical protein
MKFTLGVALTPLDQLIPLAQVAEQCGFSSIALPDSIFFSEQVAAAGVNRFYFGWTGALAQGRSGDITCSNSVPAAWGFR